MGTLTNVQVTPTGWPVGLLGGHMVAESPGGLYPERYGLGNTERDWPDLRIFANPGPQLSFTPDGAVAMIPFKIPWGRHYDLVRQLLGYPFFDAAGYMKRHLPEPLRNWSSVFDNNPLVVYRPMHCTRVGPVAGVGDGADTERFLDYPDPGYEWARVPAHFETLLYDVALRDNLFDETGKPLERQRFVIKTEHSGGRFLTQNYGSWELVLPNGRKPILNQNVNFWEAFNTIRYEWLDVLPGAVDWPRVVKLAGHTNNKDFDGYPKGTLALLRPDRIPKMTPLGIRTYRIVYDILHVPTGVNKAKGPAPGDGYGDVVKRGGGVGQGNQPFDEGDFDNLFKP